MKFSILVYANWDCETGKSRLVEPYIVNLELNLELTNILKESVNDLSVHYFKVIANRNCITQWHEHFIL